MIPIYYIIFFFVQVLGLLLIGLAVWMLTDPIFNVGMTQDSSDYYTGISLLLVVGTLLFLTGFLGCCGAHKENQCMLVMVCFPVLTSTPTKHPNSTEIWNFNCCWSSKVYVSIYGFAKKSVNFTQPWKDIPAIEPSILLFHQNY